MPRFILALLVACSSLLAAQTAPSGSPEGVLAGIDLQEMHIADVQKLYGPQEAMFAVPPNSYPEGTKLYKWGRLTVTLRVLTEPSPKGGVIKAVDVQGEGAPGDNPINKTGRGLKLGAKVAEVKKLYGVEAATGSTKLQWSDGTTLVVTINDKGRVSKLELRAP